MPDVSVVMVNTCVNVSLIRGRAVDCPRRWYGSGPVLVVLVLVVVAVAAVEGPVWVDVGGTAADGAGFRDGFLVSLGALTVSIVVVSFALSCVDGVGKVVVVVVRVVMVVLAGSTRVVSAGVGTVAAAGFLSSSSSIASPSPISVVFARSTISAVAVDSDSSCVAGGVELVGG